MRMQSDEGDFTKVSGVHVRDDVEQQTKHFPHVRFKARRKLIRIFGGEIGLVADGALRVGHHVVDILRRGTAVLLAFFIVPLIGSGIAGKLTNCFKETREKLTLSPAQSYRDSHLSYNVHLLYHKLNLHIQIFV